MPRPLAPCGTPAAYHRHRAHGEEACRPCKDAINALNPKAASREPAPCGTNAAHERHRKAGEHCDACWAAHAAYMRDYREKGGSNGNEARDRRAAEARERRAAFDLALVAVLAELELAA